MATIEITAYCFECQSEQPAEHVGEDCDDAVREFPTVDYLGDGSLWQPIGMHMRGYRCLTCGDVEAEPCVYD